MPRAGAGSSEYVKLERRLVLLAWLNSLLGYERNEDALADLKEASEGFDPQGRSWAYRRLAGREDKLQITLPVLARYDDNIKNHVDKVNARRAEPITLRYFQYLALLFTEIILDWRLNRPDGFLRALNEFVTARNSAKPAGEAPDQLFTGSDLDKLAFWMATGSGKTLIMHFNYLQFLHYNRQSLDNILLITPNEGLTNQHIEEMTASGISCRRFSAQDSGLDLTDPNTVRVIEITKLVEAKRGVGASVDVEAFEGSNLIFVDEGHKGSGGEAWRRFRERLGETGFTFEYSATFGQALTAARNDDLTNEYGKAIAFDYSYKYFHGDGFGKDFQILNLKEEAAERKTELLLLGNLLSFYEQQRCHAEQADELKPYNLEKPLWVFVGSSVNAVYTEAREKRSDVLTVARFLHHFLENKRNWAVKGISKLLAGKSGLTDAYGEDLFRGRFDYLGRNGANAETVYSEILKVVFCSPTGGALHLCDIRGAGGEIGLKVGGAEEYFGLTYIGDTSAFKKLVESDDAGMVVEEDALSGSLFRRIDDRDSTIGILVGAKKFMEGWNSWRVSNMGLLNFGRREGSEIIQLFGRGVRLRGLRFSLKRSTAIDGNHPDHIRLLETLNIFAVRANYMAQFREYLEREGVEVEGNLELPLSVKPNLGFLRKGLVLPRLAENTNFVEDCDILLDRDRAARVTVDLSLKVQAVRSGTAGLTAAVATTGRERVIPDDSLDLLDWEKVYLETVEFKEQKQYSNLVVQQSILKEIMASREPRLYRLVADEELVKPKSCGDVIALHSAVVSILKKYIDRFYRVQQQRWDSKHMGLRPLKVKDPNFKPYTVRVPRSETVLVEAVKKLIDEGTRIYQEDVNDLPNIYFDRHLFQPLLVERGEKIKSDPPGLNESEARFVKDLRGFVRQEAGKSLAKKEVFLLRNLSKGRGVGFFENEGFYPDFILWVKDKSKQRVVFVEPHGMRQEKAYWTDDKARLHERLQIFTKTLGPKAGLKGVTLDSFIISATPYAELRDHYADGSWSMERFQEAHILFFEDNDYAGKLFV